MLIYAVVGHVVKANTRLVARANWYSYTYLTLGLILGTELVLDLGLGSLSIFFIVGY